MALDLMMPLALGLGLPLGLGLGMPLGSLVLIMIIMRAAVAAALRADSAAV